MIDLLNAECSFFTSYFHKVHKAWCFSTFPKTALFKDLIDGKYNQNELKDKIRGMEYNSKEQLELKATVWGITASSKQSGGRGRIYHDTHSGFLAFDIDNLTDVEGTKAMILEKIPYLVYCSTSIRGRGLWGLFKITHPEKHKQHFEAMRRLFQFYNIEIDTAPSNEASLRFISFDSDAYLNEGAKVFNLIYEEPKAIKKPYKPKAGIGIGLTVADDFNMNGQIEPILLNHGYTLAGTKGTSIRYTRPGKTTGISADYSPDRKLLFVWSSDPATGLPVSAPRAFNHFAVFRELEANGCNKTACQKLNALGYGK